MTRWSFVLVAASGIVAGLAGGIVGARLGGDAMVHRYLLAHPDVIPAAMEVLRDRETAKIVAENRAAIVTPYPGAVSGNPSGKVSLVEYFDYNCGYCRASLATIDALAKANPDLRIVYRELPVLAPSSRDAALASLAAARHGRYDRFHTALYAAGPVSAETIAAAGKTAGTSTAAPADAETELAKNLRTAGALGLNGTPGWVVGTRVLQGAQTADVLQAAIDAARGSATPDAG